MAEELKFIRLSNDYEYGKFDDEEMNFKYRVRDNLYELEEFKPAVRVEQARIKLLRKYSENEDEILGQK